MGSDSSKFGGLKIELENYIVNAGDKVSGKIHIFVKEELPPSQLCLIFKGVERTSWSEQHGKHRVHYSGKSVITKVKYFIHSWDGVLSPGSITVPFMFVTPTQLPGSFQYFGSDSLQAVVEYYFRIFIKNEKAYFKDKQSIYIAGIEIYQNIANEPVSPNLVSCLCVKKKQITMNVKWINNWYTYGGTIDCVLEVDNTKSLCNVKYITATVFMGLNVVSGSGHTRYFRHELMRTNYYIPIKKGKILNAENGGRFSFDLNKAANPLNFINVHTSASQMINSNFFVSFELNTDACWLCGGDKPEYSTLFFVKPNRLFPAPAPIEAGIIADGWNPEYYRPVSIEYDVRNEIDDKEMSQKLMEWKSSGGNKA